MEHLLKNLLASALKSGDYKSFRKTQRRADPMVLHMILECYRLSDRDIEKVGRIFRKRCRFPDYGDLATETEGLNWAKLSRRVLITNGPISTMVVLLVRPTYLSMVVEHLMSYERLMRLCKVFFVITCWYIIGKLQGLFLV